MKYPIKAFYSLDGEVVRDKEQASSEKREAKGLKKKFKKFKKFELFKGFKKGV